LSHALAESKEAGTPSVKIHFELLYKVDSPSVPTNKAIWHDLWLSEACFERSIHTLTKTLGWNGSNLAELNSNPVLLADAECVLVTKTEEYKGKTQIKVKFVNEIQKKLDPVKVSALCEKLSGKLQAYKDKSPVVNEPGADADEPLPMPEDGMPGF
jgi:hypothetical protein